MAGSVIVKETADLLNEVYKNVRMASESIMDLMPKVRSERFKSDLTVQLSTYEGYASRAAELLAEEGAKPNDGSAWAKLGAKWGIMMNTAKDPTTEHQVQMMIEGTTMGVGELLRWIREAEKQQVSESALRLAREVCDYQEKTVEALKEYLRVE